VSGLIGGMRRRSAMAALGVLAVGKAHLARAASVPVALRIVSVGGALTEMIYALNAEKDLVGVDTTSLYPEVARTLPSVGYARALSAEGLLALAPTQVIATEDAGPPAVLRQLGAVGVPLTILPANHRFEGMLDRLARVGAIAARTAEAARLTQVLRNEWQVAEAQVAARSAARRNKPPKVLFVLSHSISQVMVAGNDTNAKAMIEYAGGVNALTGFSGFKPLTPEAVIAAAPDVVLGTEQGLKAAGGPEGLLKLPGLADTPAGRSQRVVALEAMLLLGFGPRLPLAVRQLDAAFAAVVRA
jgi:iron complex transport system substrate-binding protein